MTGIKALEAGGTESGASLKDFAYFIGEKRSKHVSYVLIIKICSSTFRGLYKRYIIKVISELVDINHVVPSIRDPFVDAG